MVLGIAMHPDGGPDEKELRKNPKARLLRMFTKIYMFQDLIESVEARIDGNMTYFNNSRLESLPLDQFRTSESSVVVLRSFYISIAIVTIATTA